MDTGRRYNYSIEPLDYHYYISNNISTDICGGSGSKGCSIYGPTFNGMGICNKSLESGHGSIIIITVDESFAVRHTHAGVLGMANQGRNTNNSQFYITLKPCPWMDKKYVAFGYVYFGILHNYDDVL